MRRTVPLLAAAAVAGLVPVASAAAATPLQLATDGEQPWVLVDRQGVTHVAWETTDGTTSRTFYRRALPGSRSFSPAVELPVGANEDFAGIYITQDPAPSNRLVLFTERCCATGVPSFYALTSTDNGATWSPAQAISDPSPSVNPTDGPVNIVANAGSTFYAVNGNPSMRLITIPGALTPGQPVVPADAQTALSPDPLDGQVVLDAAGTPYFAHANFDGNSFVRVGAAGTDVPVVTGSSIITTIKLAAGPRGVVALTEAGTALRQRIETRLVTGGVVGPPVALAPAGGRYGVPFVAADPTGRFHAVWRQDGNSLRYRRSENGVSWSATQTLFTTTTSSIFNPVASAGPDGNGWVVWIDSTSRARVLALPLSAAGDPSVPDTTGIDNPRVTRRGSTIVVSPRSPSLRKLRRTKCVNVRVQSTRPANIRVAIFSGRRSVRIFGATVVRFRQPGKRLVCIRVPLRARTFNVRQPFRFAFATRFLNTPPNRPVPQVTTPFVYFR